MRLCLTISKGDFNFAGTKVITKWDTIFIKEINKTKPVFNKIPINMTVNKQEHLKEGKVSNHFQTNIIYFTNFLYLRFILKLLDHNNTCFCRFCVLLFLNTNIFCKTSSNVIYSRTVIPLWSVKVYCWLVETVILESTVNVKVFSRVTRWSVGTLFCCLYMVCCGTGSYAWDTYDYLTLKIYMFFLLLATLTE